MLFGTHSTMSQTIQTATVNYDVKSGDSFTYTILAVDPGFSLSGFTVGNTYTVTVTADPSTVSAQFSSGPPETLTVSDASYFSSNDFNGVTAAGNNGLILPLKATLSNGTVLSIDKLFPLIFPTFTAVLSNQISDQLYVQGYFGAIYYSMIFDATTGVLSSYTLNDANGNAAVITGGQDNSGSGGSGSGSGSDINAQLMFQPSAGTVFTFQVTRRDANFNVSDFEFDVQVGDTFKLEVLKNLNISGVYNPDYNTLDITDTGQYLKLTYPNGTTTLDTYESTGLLEPTQVDLANGTVLNLLDVLNIELGDFASVQEYSSSIAVNLSFGFNATLLYSKSTGVLLSESVVDPSGNAVVIEEGNYLSTHGTDTNINGGSNSSSNSAGLPLPINTPMIFTTLGILTLLTYRRRVFK